MRCSNFFVDKICIFLFLICATAILANSSLASEKNENKETKSNSSITVLKSSSGPYCGLYCLYTIVRLANRKINFVELFEKEYVSSHKGSSMAQLEKVAEKYGLYSLPASKLTSVELSRVEYPIVLHVKSRMENQQYDHYELFLGTKDSKAILFDPPNPVRLVPFSELAPRWDGNGLIVSAEPIDFASVIAPARRRFIVYSMVVIAIILALHWTKRLVPKKLLDSRIKLMGLSIAQAGAFAVAALIIGMLYHFTNDEGLLANASATDAIQQAHAGNFIPKITERKVHKLLGNHTVFIDARLARDYKSGHLKGAISVPVNSSDEERQKATADIDKDAHVVLYCQSAGCKYAEIVAFKLIEDGYSDVSIFKGGWVEWAAKNGKIKQEQS